MYGGKTFDSPDAACSYARAEIEKNGGAKWEHHGVRRRGNTLSCIGQAYSNGKPVFSTEQPYANLAEVCENGSQTFDGICPEVCPDGSVKQPGKECPKKCPDIFG